MHFEKYLLNFLTIILVYCTCYGESGLNEIDENNLLGFNPPGIGSSFLKNGDNMMLSSYNHTEGNAVEAECKCKNGRCETQCAVWKNGACLRTKQVCVCDPEFGKYDDETCIYCDCGIGFNCTINRQSRGDSRVCTCPEGYYDYSGECAPFCSESRPCRNGGTCEDGRCNCDGTHGPFCERIFRCAFECRPRLSVDCVYNQKDKIYDCLCKNRSLIFDYRENICKPCPCGEGTCIFDMHYLKCKCKDGYQEFQKQCRKCDCGDEATECKILENGEKQCKCRNGFFEREGTCRPCECDHDEATCTLDSYNRKICICPDGYEDNLGRCEKKEDCKCHITAKCYKSGECYCEDGYKGEQHDNPLPGEPCIDIDECENKDRCSMKPNQKCVNFPGSFMCQCKTGYQPVGEANFVGEITCEKHKSSWLPAGITLAVAMAFLAILVGYIIFLKHREASRLSTGFEMRGTR